MTKKEKKTFNVHVYTIVRVKVSGIEATTQKEALDLAGELVADRAHRLYATDVWGANSMYLPTQEAAITAESEWAEEHAFYLVDQVGDKEFSQTHWYDSRGRKSDARGKALRP